MGYHTITFMAIETKIPMHVHSRNNRDLPSTPGTLDQFEWTMPERVKNAGRTFGLFIALTFAAIFVPIAHYILVPSLLITSFVLAIDKYQQAKSFEGGVGICPKCKAEMKIQKSKFKERLTDICASCGEDVEVLLG